MRSHCSRFASSARPTAGFFHQTLAPVDRRFELDLAPPSRLDLQVLRSGSKHLLAHPLHLAGSPSAVGDTRRPAGDIVCVTSRVMSVALTIDVMPTRTPDISGSDGMPFSLGFAGGTPCCAIAVP